MIRPADFFELEGGCGQIIPLTRDEQDLKQHTSETPAASDKLWVFKVYKSWKNWYRCNTST